VHASTASDELNTMIDAARAAGRRLLEHFRAREPLSIVEKAPGDFVSAADLESEQTLRAMLLGSHADYGFIAEESAELAHRETAHARFIVDPLDGTTNFLRGIPHFAVSIALEHGDRVVAGVVFDPAKDEMFVAEAGRGAWLGDQRLHVCADHQLARAIVGTGIPHGPGAQRRPHYLAMLGATMPEVAGIRRLGAAAIDLAYVAAGRFAAFFEFGLAAWDLAAGALLVTEAGGHVSTPAGGSDFLRQGDVLATNGHLHETMARLLNRSGREVQRP
jgi:myo-inositol-1(or 4)-monophosphatase